MTVEEMGLPAVLRAARHEADLSQRQLARTSGVSPRTVAAIESGASGSPTFRVVQRLLAAAGCTLVVRDHAGRELLPLGWEGEFDRGGRNWPAHLDPVPVRSLIDVRAAASMDGELPTRTFHRDRARRDIRRDLDHAQVAPELSPVDIDVVVETRGPLRIVRLTRRQRVALGPGRALRVVVRDGRHGHAGHLRWIGRSWCVVFRAGQCGGARWGCPAPHESDQDGGIEHCGFLDRPGPRRLAVEVAVDCSPALPPDLGALLEASERAALGFLVLREVHRREFARWVAESKRRDTRDLRLALTAAWMDEIVRTIASRAGLCEAPGDTPLVIRRALPGGG